VWKGRGAHHLIDEKDELRFLSIRCCQRFLRLRIKEANIASYSKSLIVTRPSSRRM
jgi:hypothetical protein